MTRGGIGDEIYALLFKMLPQQRRTALEYAQLRLAEDSRAEEAAAHAGPKPSFWCLDGQGLDYGAPSIDEALDGSDATYGDVVEAAGYAVVEQRFLAIRPNDDGPAYESFPTRAEAESYVAGWKAGFSNPPTPTRPEGMEIDEFAAFMAWWKLVEAKGAWVDEAATDNLDSVSWVLRFRANMTPDQAFADCDLIPF